MSKKSIPDDIKKQVEEIVQNFNNKVVGSQDHYYNTRYKGNYLYLDRKDYGQNGPICRLKYNGDISDWDFAIYKYSSERYDPDEWFFPGAEEVDGTIEGAMKAGNEAYP